MRYTERMNNIGLLIKLAILMAISVVLLIANTANAQQMIVDDAAVTTERSFQVETWYGTEESIFMPAVGIGGWLEIAGAVGLDSGDNFAFANYMLESKIVNGDFEQIGQAFGLVGGLVLDDAFAFEEFYAYVPYSKLILNNSSVLHVNLGGAFHSHIVDHGTHTHDEGVEFELMYGVRGDFGIHDRFALISEIFAEGTDFFFHGGMRISVVLELLEMDITYGRGFKDGLSFPGLNIGIAFTPDSLW